MAVLLAASAVPAELPAPWRAALDRISPASLEGHTSFLASDLLEGRDTPSRGLDIAAEYIAAQFRRAGLEPGGDDGYFQTARWALRERDYSSAEMTLQTADRIVRVAPDHLACDAPGNLEINEEAVFKLDIGKLDGADPATLRGRVIAAALRGSGGAREARAKAFRAYQEITRLAASASPLLTLITGELEEVVGLMRQPRLVDPAAQTEAMPPLVAVMERLVNQAIAKAAPGETGMRVTLRCAGASEMPAALRNVVGILRGADPALRDTAVIVSAHYDHIGMAPPGDGDRIFNGANDDASGTAAMLELARVLAGLPEKPRRSVVFVAYFGEEKGMLGSDYYARHPAFPLRDTVANINLEQLGRTDDTEGPQIRRASVTGFDYSGLGRILREAGKATGIKVFRHPQNSDPFFRMSDNISLARRGVPAHTVSVACRFPDVHGAGDHWEKMDYGNMAAVTRMIAAATLMVANNETAPGWNEANPQTEPYRKARQTADQQPALAR